MSRSLAMALLLKNLLFTLVVPATVAVYLPLAIAGRRDWPSLAEAALAVGVLAAGAAIYGWCVWDFATAGRGTPLPIDPPRQLVVRGLYRCTRNPMYLGVLLVILGWAILFRSAVLLLYALAVAAGFQSFVVLYEEPHLARVFGRPYEEYCRQVGRWLPRRRRTG